VGMMSSIGNGVKWSLKPFFEVSQWIAGAEVKRQAKIIRDEAVAAGGVKKATRSESFAQAAERFGLTEQDILIRQRSFLRLTLTFAGMSLLAFCYALYLFWHGTFWAGMVGFVVGLVGLGYAFRYHFWFFQVKHRKLGCTIREWLQGNAGGEA